MSRLCSTHRTIFPKPIYLCILNLKSKGIHLLVLNSPHVGLPAYLPLLLLFTNFDVAHVGLEPDPLASDSGLQHLGLQVCVSMPGMVYSCSEVSALCQINIFFICISVF